MRSPALRSCVLAALAGGFVQPAFCANHGLIAVQVTSPDGAPLGDVSIDVTSPALLGARKAVTSSRGAAIVAGLPPGSYRVLCSREAFRPVAHGVVLAQNQRLDLTIDLELTEVREVVEVHAPSLVVDTRTATVSDHLDLEQAAALPVGRDYRAYAQLVAGVNVVPNSNDLEPRYEPASKAGNFYHDRGAQLGSRDNVYYLDGLDFTDMGSGSGELLFHTEAISDEEVITSVPSAEYGGGAGYVANLVTKAGGASFAGTAEFFVQTPSMQESYDTPDTRLHTPEEDRWDAGATLGGPLLPDRLWFFGAAHWRESSDEVHLSDSASPTPQTRTFQLRQRPVLLKFNASPSASDSLTALVHHDPRETIGSRSVNTPANRDSELEDTFSTGSLDYHRQFGRSLLTEARLVSYRREAQSNPLDVSAGPTNTLLFEPGLQVPAYLRDLGSSGGGGSTTYRKWQAALATSWFFEGSGSHQLEIGFHYDRWEEEVANDPSFDTTLTSLAPHLAGTSFARARDLAFLPPSEYDVVLRAVQQAPGSAAHRTADANGDGMIADAEFAAVAFSSSADNHGGINFLRNRIVKGGVNNVGQYTHAIYAQEDWRLRSLAFTLGVRAEDRRYVASDGSTILDMDTDLFPRAGVVYDIGGKGLQRLSLGYGRYSDPLRTSMMRFAGNLTGSIFADEIIIGDNWFRYRVRGQESLPRDAGFAPNLENETEEEYQLTYGVNLAEKYGLLVQLFRRRDQDIIEDYDPNLYFNPTASGELALTPGDFGYPPSGAGSVNYFLANLIGGERRTYGLDLSLTRRYTDNWSGSFQYSWRDAEGNSNSDGAADLQGDFLVLDPRQPYMWGDLPGTIPHQVKIFGTYQAPFGLEIGGLFYWNDGAVFTESTIFRPTSHGIYYNHQRADGTFAKTGDGLHPSYWTQDLRLRYVVPGQRGFETELVLDILNFSDEQDAVRVSEGHNNPEFATYLEPRLLLQPRRYQLGARARW